MNHQKQQIKDRMVEIWGREPRDLDDFAHCIIAVLNRQSATRQSYGKPRKDHRLVKVAGMAWNIKFSQGVANTHECPIDGVTNWDGRTEGAPRAYPGWLGRVWVRYAEDVDGFGSDPWHATLTYPGAGGSGGYGGPWEKLYRCWYEAGGRKRGSKVDMPEPRIYSWDYKFFLQDWPSLEAQLTWDILADWPNQNHKFQWEDPEIVQQDQEFLKKFGERHYAV